MAYTIVKFIIIHNEQTSELCIEKRNVLYDNEEILRPNHSIVSRGRERLVWYYNKVHLITPYHYVVKVYSAINELSGEKPLLETNVLSMKNFLLRNDAIFKLQTAIVRIDSRMYRVFITARSNSLFRYVENDEVMYEKFL